jgi:hypothetical protein
MRAGSGKKKKQTVIYPFHPIFIAMKLVIRFISLSVILLIYINSSAQNPDTSVYHLTHSTTGFVNRTTDGNSYLVNNNLRFNISKKRISTNSTNSWVYGSQESGLTNNDFSSTLDFNLFKSVSKFYYWGLATYDKSYSLKIR